MKRRTTKDWSPRYNVAPRPERAVVRQDAVSPVRLLSRMRWGLIPSWAKDAAAIQDDQRPLGNRR